MAKTAIKTKDQAGVSDAKNYTKVIRAIKNTQTGAYSFKENIIHKDKTKDFLAHK